MTHTHSLTLAWKRDCPACSTGNKQVTNEDGCYQADFAAPPSGTQTVQGLIYQPYQVSI